jgi:hypothetical protein
MEVDFTARTVEAAATITQQPGIFERSLDGRGFYCPYC